jgi:hypothetical protein
MKWFSHKWNVHICRVGVLGDKVTLFYPYSIFSLLKQKNTFQQKLRLLLTHVLVYVLGVCTRRWKIQWLTCLKNLFFIK